MGQQHGAAALGIALEIHQDVHTVGADDIGRLQIRQAANVAKAMKRRHQALTHALAVVLPMAVGIQLHLRRAVRLQHLHHQQGRCMLMEITGQIANLQRPLRPRHGRPFHRQHPAPALRIKRRQPRLQPARRAGPLRRSINTRHRQQQKRRPHRPIVPLQLRPHPIRPEIKVLPLTPSPGANVVEDLSACRHACGGLGVHAGMRQELGRGG
jgi:hypothetical protein